VGSRSQDSSSPQLKVGYLCACYFGRRRRNDGWDQSLSDPSLTFIIKQLEVLPRYATILSRITFVCNVDEGDAEQLTSFESAQKLVEAHNAGGCSIPCNILHRPNENYSYGAYAWGIKEHCSDLDYVFTVEDDFLPGFHGFDRDVVQRYFSNKSACGNIIGAVSVWVDDTILAKEYNWLLPNTPPHASVSHGIMNVSIYNSVPGGFAFSDEPNMYGAATQCVYLDPYINAGYRVINMSQHYRTPYLGSRRGTKWMFGPENAPIIFEPVESRATRVIRLKT